MKTSLILTVSILTLTGCGHSVRSSTAALTADNKNWPVCYERIESLEFDNQTVKSGELICANSETTVRQIQAERKAAQHRDMNFQLVPVKP